MHSACIICDQPWATFADVYQAAAVCALTGKEHRIATLTSIGFAVTCHLKQHVHVAKWPWVIGWSTCEWSNSHHVQLTLVPDTVLCDDEQTLYAVLNVLNAQSFAYSVTMYAPSDMSISTETYVKCHLLQVVRALFDRSSGLTETQQDTLRRWVKRGYRVSIPVDVV